MNSKGLSKHYSALDPAERLSLLLAAAARGDDVEGDRLLATAPRVTARVPHTFWRAMAFREVLDWFWMERLELAALYFRSSHLACEVGSARRPRLALAAKVFAYVLESTATGWRRFCEAHQLAPAAFESLLPGGSVLSHAIEEATSDALTAEEVAEFNRTECEEPYRLRTPEVVEGELTLLFRERLAAWGSE